MSKKFRRPLDVHEYTLDFMKNILELNDNTIKMDSKVITQMEINIDTVMLQNTYESEKYRIRDYKDEAIRKSLQNQILDELCTQPRLSNDDDIKLGIGGCLPRSGLPREKKQAYFVIGTAASGKSGVVNNIVEHKKAVVLDSDYAKRKLPEYRDKKAGASLVHDESSRIIFGAENGHLKDNCLALFCIEFGFNVVIPKIGWNSDKLYNEMKRWKSHGYDIHLILLSVDRQIATKRAYLRFKNTGRYVPLLFLLP